MYEVIEKLKTLPDGTQIRTFTRDVVSCNLLEVEAGTTGYKGGDTGHGSRTYFRIHDCGCTDMTVQSLVDKYGCTSLEVILGGDTELETMIRALKFITKVLEEESQEVHD